MTAPAVPDERPAATALPASGGGSGHHPVRHEHHKKHKAHIEHKTPGRIRIKVPSGKNNPEVLDSFKAAFSGVPGISSITTRPETGSIILQYDPAREAEFHGDFHSYVAQQQMMVGPKPGDEISDIADKIEAEAEFLAEHSHLARHAVDFMKSFDRELKLVSGNTIDLKIILAGGLAAYTFLEIGAEAATPMWVTLGLFTLNQLAELKSGGHPPAAR